MKIEPEDKHSISEMSILAASAADEASKGAETGEIIARGTLLAGDLANLRGNTVVLATLAEVARSLASIRV